MLNQKINNQQIEFIYNRLYIILIYYIFPILDIIFWYGISSDTGENLLFIFREF